MSQKRDKEKHGNLTEIEEKKNKTRKNRVLLMKSEITDDKISADFNSKN